MRILDKSTVQEDFKLHSSVIGRTSQPENVSKCTKNINNINLSQGYV